MPYWSQSNSSIIYYIFHPINLIHHILIVLHTIYLRDGPVCSPRNETTEIEGRVCLFFFSFSIQTRQSRQRKRERERWGVRRRGMEWKRKQCLCIWTLYSVHSYVDVSSLKRWKGKSLVIHVDIVFSSLAVPMSKTIGQIGEKYCAPSHTPTHSRICPCREERKSRNRNEKWEREERREEIGWQF